MGKISLLPLDSPATLRIQNRGTFYLGTSTNPNLVLHTPTFPERERQLETSFPGLGYSSFLIPLYNKDSVQFSHSAVPDSLRTCEPQRARPPCPSPTLRVYPNSCPLSRWYHPTISSSVVLFSSCPQSFPASGSFQMSRLFASGAQSIGVSASTSVLPMNTQDWSPSGWTSWISLKSKGLSRVFSNTTVQNHQLFFNQLSL